MIDLPIFIRKQEDITCRCETHARSATLCFIGGADSPDIVFSRRNPRTRLSHLQRAHTTNTSLKEQNSQAQSGTSGTNVRNRAIRDPRLAPVKNITPIVFFFCSRFHARGIGPMIWLRQALIILRHLCSNRYGSSCAHKASN